MRRVLRVLLMVLGAGLGTACKGMGDITAPRPLETPVASVVLSSTQLTVSEGSSVALQVIARDADNRPLADRSVAWSSSDVTIARVSVAGLVTGMRAGSAQIAASVDGRSAVAHVTITPRAVASIQVTPASPSVLKGAFVQLTARTLDESGGSLTDRPVFWSSSDSRVAVVDVTGLVTGVSPGVATVTATSETRNAAVGVTVLSVPVASVQVTPAHDTVVVGQSTQVTATARDSIGAPLDDPVTFTTSAPSVATVSSSGLVVGVAAGTAIITASSGGRSGTSVIVVQPRPVGAVIVSPAQASLTVGQSVMLSVQITDASGNLLTGRPVNFSSSNVNVAQVSTNGTVTATAPGVATITITSEGKTGTANIVVAPSPIATLRIDPATLTMLVGATARLSPVAQDAGGNVLGQRVVTWTSGAPNVVAVSNDGVLTALAAGTAIVFATAEGRIATATITVNAIAATTMTVTPPTATVIAGQSLDLTAVLRSGTGQVLEGRLVTWSSSNSAVALVSSTGRVRGVSSGTARIDATSDGVTGSSAITVIPVPVATVTVTLAATSLLVSQTTQATAVARDADGGVLTGREVTWSSSNVAVATVSASGLVTAVSLGTANIIGTSEGRVGTAPLSVVVGSATAIAAVSATTQTAAAGTAVSEPPSVRVTDIGGSPVAGVVVTFALTGGGGSMVPNSPATVTTNAAGIAALTSWTLGVTPGANTLTATVSALTGSPVTFTATGTVGTPRTIAANSVLTQSATAGTAVSVPPSVVVRDAVGNAVSGVNVTFAVTGGGGTVSPASVTTDASGIATLTSWTLGAVAGTNTVTATVSGLTGSPVTFTATGTVGAARTIAANSPVSQSATAGTAVSEPPGVKVVDDHGNAVSGVSVTFAVTAGGGAVTPSSVSTDANGIATVTTWTLGATAGANTVAATSPGLTGSPVLFNAMGTAGAATQLAVTAQPGGAESGKAFTSQPVAAILDAGGNLTTSTAAVSVEIASGTGTLSGTTTVNAVGGVATFTNLVITGTGAHTLTFTSGALTAATSASFTVTPGAPTRVAMVRQPGGAVSGVAFTTQPAVELRDAANDVAAQAGVVVTVTKASGPGALSGTLTATTDASGVATFTDLAITGTGSYTLTFTSDALTAATSATFNVAPGPATQVVITTPPGGAVSGVAFTAQPVVELLDANGDRANSSAAVTVTISDGNGTLSGTTTVNAVDGVAIFADLSIAGSGAHTLSFSANGIVSEALAVVTVTQIPASLAIATQPDGAVTDAPFTTQPVIHILDNAGLLITSGSNASLQVTVSKVTGDGTLKGTTTVTASNGVATFGDLVIDVAGPHQLRFEVASPALSVTSVEFVVASP